MEPDTDKANAEIVPDDFHLVEMLMHLAGRSRESF